MKKYHFYGKLCSWFYEIEKPFSNERECQFYLSFADEKMNILEPMCGTGRFLVRFIEKGLSIDGFDLSKEMLEICKSKIEKLPANASNILQCSNFKNFLPNKKYDYIFIPSGSFSLIIGNNNIIESINILEGLCKQNGRILLELLINNDLEKNVISDVYSQNRSVKQGHVEIVLLHKTTAIDEKDSIEYSMFKYELYENGKYVREEEEAFNVKYYMPNEFEKYLENTSLKIENKYANHEKEKYINQSIERIIYEITKE